MKMFKDLKFTDDFMFGTVLVENPELCKEITETILNVKIREIVKIDNQYSLRSRKDGKGVRFDVYFEDDDNIYDIEMQTSNSDDLRKRSRYYQSLIDRKTLDRGKDYSKLRKTFVIFICTFDLFGKGLPKYTFENICREDKSIKLDDDAVKVFVNAASTKDCENRDMGELLHFIKTGEAEGTLPKKIKSNMDRVKTDPELEEAYMTYQEKLDQSYEKGIQEGRQETELKNAKAMYVKGISPDIIKEITGIDVEKLSESVEESTLLNETMTEYHD